MKKNDIETRVNMLLDSGISKQDVLERLSEEGIKPLKVAHAIASHLDPLRRAACKGHRKVLIAMSYVQAVLAVLIILAALGHRPHDLFSVVLVAFVVAFSGLFIWGFTKDLARAYNAYILLGLVQSVQSLPGIGSLGGLLGIVISLTLIGYVFFVRKKMFPDFAFIRPRRVHGQYVFVEDQA